MISTAIPESCTKIGPPRWEIQIFDSDRPLSQLLLEGGEREIFLPMRGQQKSTNFNNTPVNSQDSIYRVFESKKG